MSATVLRTPTWENVGNTVRGSKNLDDVLSRSGLDFEVVKKEIQTTDGIIIPDKVATVRTDTNKPFGIVSKKYQVCQNKDAFDFVNYISDDLQYEKAGITNNGLVYIIASMEQVNILGDVFTPYVIFQNGHCGNYTLKSTITPLRIVCQNQFSLIFKENQSTINIKHSRTMQSKMDSAKEVLRTSADYMKRFSQEAEKYANIKITNKQMKQILDEFFPIKDDMRDSTREKLSENRAMFMKAYEEDDNYNFRNTYWGMLNAIADYTTHKKPERITENWEENKFVCVTFNPVMMEYLNIMNSIVA